MFLEETISAELMNSSVSKTGEEGKKIDNERKRIWADKATRRAEDREANELPKKKFYRQRAHSNPMSDHNFVYPLKPSLMNWKELYPVESVKFPEEKVRFVDVGCGYGGLLMKLAEGYPEKIALGMEIRVKVLNYVNDRIRALQVIHPDKTEDGSTAVGTYNRIGCIRTNAMKLLPHFFEKGQIEKFFFLFPDPHFKKAKHKWRIISDELLSEYAYLMAEGAIVYTITDVKKIYKWICEKFEAHPLFERIPDEEMTDDPAYKAIFNSTEEGQRVQRNGGHKFPAIWRRIK